MTAHRQFKIDTWNVSHGSKDSSHLNFSLDKEEDVVRLMEHVCGETYQGRGLVTKNNKHSPSNYTLLDEHGRVVLSASRAKRIMVIDV